MEESCIWEFGIIVVAAEPSCYLVQEISVSGKVGRKLLNVCLMLPVDQIFPE